MVVLPRSILIVLTICQPILLNRLLDYLTESSEPKEKDIGYGLIGAYALVYFGIAISTGFYWYYHYRVLTMIRWCLVSTIGVKTLQLNTHSVEDPKAAVTLMSTDVERIIFGLRSFHEFWANAIQAGFSASFWRGSLTAWASYSQLRVGTISRMLSSIKPLKMRGRTGILSPIFQNIRPQEIKLVNRFRMLLVWTTGIGYVPQFISPPLTFLLFILRVNGNGQPFDSSRAFTSLSLLLILAQSLSQTLLDLPPLLASFGSSSRIDKFLSTESRVDIRHFPALSDEPRETTFEKKYHPEQTIIEVTNGSFGWKDDRDVLHNINITIPQGQTCALVTNIDSLPRGNETIVGSDGINLSGGQKQKIAIARALYALKPILLFDDVLSGLDYTGASHIFREVIGPKGLAQQHGITVIIATHATEYLPFADHIIALDKSGQVIQQGSFQSLRSQSGYIGSLTIAENFEKEETVVNTDQAASKSVGASVNNEKYNENLPIRQSGDFRIYGYYFEAAGIWISCLLLVLVISYATLCIFSTYWMRIWVDTFSFSRPARLDDLGYWAVYTVLQSSALFLLLGVVYHTLIHFVSRAGSSLHRDILDVVINVPLSFFGSTGIGVTINCFSQDIQLVDNELPMALLNWLLTVFLALGQIILIIIASPWVEFAFIDIVLILYTMQNFYLRTSRQLRLLELEAKSPSYSNFLENLNGLSTLRAFGWTAQAVETSYK
ncbi:hypothetical protein H103_00504 [Trichophyton rubrum CBS 288.86]|uniref:ABC transmembrane type-1 domain-containing protein n=1 Tax=Trichophyton rubrum CBS 288.86 TaxID=1215330 RepID=A0A022WFM7_TRIRU|nr:hypothetical protein H103_00504 [Trichophyton rubrum CBS 288.86]EZF67785.1 hypothetical protein H104_00494 [Trichophyton rubrum CBS 289.86]EZG21432.1 hypothetical protein H107_00550 [Trichophyton rubrum CBS 202.88]